MDDSYDRAAITILLNALTASDALQRLYHALKQRDPAVTLKFLCKRAGIPSTGYLSDIVHGRRRLHPKYRAKIARAFGLSGQAERCLNTMLALEGTKGEEARRALADELALVRKSLAIPRRTLPSGTRDLCLAIEAFCAFGLFANQPSFDDLVAYFGEPRAEEVRGAVTTLKALGLVKEEGRHFVPLTTGFLFDQGNGIDHVDFLKTMIADGAASAEKWFPKTADAYFAASIISVSAVTYREKLARLKEQMLMAQADLESSDADRLIHFNIQVYPIGEP